MKGTQSWGNLGEGFSLQTLTYEKIWPLLKLTPCEVPRHSYT